MAKRNKGIRNKFGDMSFAAVKLSAETKPEFDAWLEANGADYLNWCEIMASDGWKLSQRWDGENDTYIMSATMVDEDDRNYNVVVVSRSDSFAEAVLMNYFKVYIMYDKKKLPTEAPQDKWG